ncbi:hypothetical protein BDV29DRAFT_183707 [Aspergillus leporis]|uniref:Uncharacterized protein n=1 Tax=Aspergillus leporis TaxID=41062 RepID=A0A5N5WK69_9EURO|nr:hypothetical protein BDV29DRAFT_183707 [Aspergillus leporis]
MQDETVLYLSIGSFILMLAGLARLLLPMESLSEREILQDGYKKDYSTWKMWTSVYPLHISPIGALPSLRTDKTVDLAIHVHDQYQTEYTEPMCSSPFMRSVQVDLNNHMSKMISH